MGMNEITVYSLNDEAKRVLAIVQAHGPVTKANLVLLTNLAISTLLRIMRPLEKLRLITEERIGESTGGRKPILYDVNPHRFFMVGIDISRTYTQIVVVNMKMQVLSRERFEMTAVSTPEWTVAQIRERLQDKMTVVENGKEVLLGIGVGTVGPLDREEGILLNPDCFAAAGWENVSLKNMVEKVFRVPVFVDNGANAAILAESRYGVARDNASAAYIHFGVGIRTGAVSSGVLIRSLNSTEDALAHMVIDMDGERCSCGNYGCLERYASIPVIVKRFVSEIKKGRKSLLDDVDGEPDYRDICQAAEVGDPLASEVIGSAAAALGIGLANLVRVLSPELVILSGPLVRHSEMFYTISTDVAAKKSRRTGPVVAFSRGGHFNEDTISMGAAIMVMDACLKMKNGNSESGGEKCESANQ